MKVKIQLVENNPLHRVPSIFLNIYRTQYIFNVIPTVLRHRKKQKINLYNSSYIFFTKNNIEAFGGLPNYLLFRSGSQHSDIMIANKIWLYGNNQLTNYFDQMRYKLGHKSLRFSYTSWDKSNYKLGIQSLPLYQRLKNDPQLPNYFSKINSYLTQNCQKKDYFDSRVNISTMKTRYINVPCQYFHNNLIDIYPLTTTTQGTSYTHYFCIFPNQRKEKEINIEKFIAQTKITKYQLIKELQFEGKVEYEGKTYKKEDFVYRQNFKPGNILIFHYKNQQSVQAIQKSSLFQNYFYNKNKTSIVIHIIEDQQVLKSDIFRSFLSRFQKETYHYWFHNSIINLKEGQRKKYLEDNLIELKIWSEMFPGFIKNLEEERIKHYSNHSRQLISTLFPDLNHLFHQRMHHFIKNQYEGHRFQQKIESKPKIASSDLLRKTVRQYCQDINSIRKVLSNVIIAATEPKVIILGTSSSIPTASRNISGVLVNFETCSFLMDCGEETLQQIANHFSPTEFEEKLLKIKVIFISHIHSDHNLGIINLISQRKRLADLKGVNEKVYLILPFNVYHWYETYIEKIQDLSSTCEVLFTQILTNQTQQQLNDEKQSKKRGFLSKKNQSQNDLEDKLFVELETSSKTRELVSKEMPNQQKRLQKFKTFLKNNDFQYFSPVRALHCPQSFGVVIKKGNYKVSYSGDTRPSDKFKEAARNSDIMIHEATFNDQERTKAEQSKHSTVSEAVQIGYESNARYLVLTHFCNDFKIPTKIQSRQELQNYFQKNAIFSFDHLQIPIKNPSPFVSLSQLISRINQCAEKQNNDDDNIDS